MATMYQLKTEYLQLLDMMQDPDVDSDTLRDTMEGLTGELEDKFDAYAIVKQELEAEVSKRLKEIDRLEKDVKSLNGNIDRIKETMFNTMVETGQTKMKTEHFKLSIQGNGGVKPLKITGDVPEEYMKVKYEPDGTKIREALKTGELSFAHLEERGSRLVIK